MSSRTAIVWSCSHADPSCGNERFDWLGSLIYDIRPDYCIDLGDGADMKSLNTYDTRYPQSIVTQSYEADIEAYNDSQDRLRHKFRFMKRKRPKWYGIEGNHEFRIKKALMADPRLEGSRYGVSFSHLQTDHWFDEYHEYDNSAPAVATYDGVAYSHYFASGNSGRAISGIHHAYSLCQSVGNSATCGHSHYYSYYYKDSVVRPTIGHVVGCFKGKEESWAGQSNPRWRHGVVIKRNIDNGLYDHTWISMDALKKEYG